MRDISEDHSAEAREYRITDRELVDQFWDICARMGKWGTRGGIEYRRGLLGQTEVQLHSDAQELVEGPGSRVAALAAELREVFPQFVRQEQ
jgi:hypothetical protein